jgi:maltose O-acetyltransferase
MKNLRSAGQGISKNIIIEDGVWIGANTTIIGGVTIGKKSIIAAGSLVNRDIPAYTIAAGSPCKPIKVWNENHNDWDKI